MDTENIEEEVNNIEDEEIVEDASEDSADEEVEQVEESEDEVVEEEVESEDSEEESEEISEDEEPVQEEDDGLTPIPGETPSERAYRRIVTDLRRENKALKSKDVFVPKQTTSAGVLTREDQELLQQFEPEELTAFDRLVQIKLKQAGVVFQEDLKAEKYKTEGESYFDNFIKANKEYSLENDPDGVIWEQFQQEVRRESAEYKEPQKPANVKKILAQAHENLFGSKPKSSININKIKAQQQKISVASHAGASSGVSLRENKIAKANNNGLRVDMLKGFSDKELREIVD